MTDYLEQALEGSADALLQEQRRLERAVPPSWEQEMSRVQEADVSSQWTPEREAYLPLQRQMDQSGRVLAAARRLPAEQSGDLYRRMRMDDSAMAGADRKKSGWLDATAQKAGMTGGSSFSEDEGAEQNWARQVDRVFRRDSRRYDNGFFLY